jgi:hypothetical protein
VTNEFETEKLATVEVEVGGEVEAENTVVGMAAGPRIAVAREFSAPKPSCSTAKHMPPIAFFIDFSKIGEHTQPKRGKMAYRVRHTETQERKLIRLK